MASKVPTFQTKNTECLFKVVPVPVFFFILCYVKVKEHKKVPGHPPAQCSGGGAAGASHDARHAGGWAVQQASERTTPRWPAFASFAVGRPGSGSVKCQAT